MKLYLMKILSHKPLPRIILATLFSIFAAYSIVLRFTSFLIYPRSEKAILLGILIVVLASISYFLLIPFLHKLMFDCTGRLIIKILMLSILISGIIILAFFRLPAFPQRVSLVLSPLEVVNPNSLGNNITITSMHRIALPGQKPTPILLPDLTFDGAWRMDNNNLVFSSNFGQLGSVRYDGLIQGKISLEFLTGPDQGVVEIQWNDEVIKIDLYDSTPGKKVQVLSLPNTWMRADINRKILLAAGMVSDYMVLSALAFFLVLISHAIIVNVKIRDSEVHTLTGAAVLLLLMLLLSNKLDREVKFVDPGLEEVVRGLIEKPEGPIFNYQLLTIAELDLSEQQITHLEGIEALRNLKVLNLSGNEVLDVTPLTQLTQLSDLDLSDNGILSLEGIHFDKLTGLPLEKLNLRGNNRFDGLIISKLSDINLLGSFHDLIELDLGENQITDISSLSSLEKLENLMLDHNKISDISAIEHMSNLRKLNLRDNRIIQLDPLSGLVRLEYLNLHSNTRATHVQALKDLRNLEELILRNVYVGSSVDIFNGMVHLRRLNIQNSGIKDISFLGTLMSAGSLQDNPGRGLGAEVNIRDNPVVMTAGDPFVAIRSYWKKISFRNPYTLPPATGLAPPIFSVSGGYFTEAFELRITSPDPGVVIYYTLDGSEPKVENIDSPASTYQKTYLYNGPIQVKSRIGDSNVFSKFNTATSALQISSLWSPPKGRSV